MSAPTDRSRSTRDSGSDEPRGPHRPPRATRRAALKAAGAAAAGLAMASRMPAGEPSAPAAAPAPAGSGSGGGSGKKVRIGVVGGGFGTDFQWHEHPDCIVQAVSDLLDDRRKRLMQVYKCDGAYESLEKLVLDKDVDAVAIFTEAPNHVRHALECMKHGKHVISAVPACCSLEEAEQLLDCVRRTGLTYMMAETSHFQQSTISARKFQQEGRFGEIYYCESEYQHDGLEGLFYRGSQKTWRYGYPPMLYPTHCTAHLVSVTGERLTEVICHGWGDDSQILKDNVYKNPFWDESSMFRTSRGHAFRVNVWWKGAHRGCERAQWIGTKMSFYGAHPNGLPPIIIRRGQQKEKDDAGFERSLPQFERYAQPEWWNTDMLPPPLRHGSGHEGSHTFLTHEFVDSLLRGRKPAVDVYEALAYTVPGIVAHQSALAGGQHKKIPQFDPK